MTLLLLLQSAAAGGGVTGTAAVTLANPATAAVAKEIYRATAADALTAPTMAAAGVVVNPAVLPPGGHISLWRRAPQPAPPPAIVGMLVAWLENPIVHMRGITVPDRLTRLRQADERWLEHLLGVADASRQSDERWLEDVLGVADDERILV